MFTKFSFSPQVKRWAIITYKNGIYELPNKFPIDGEVNPITKALDTNWPLSQSSINPPRSVTDAKIADSSKNSGNPV